MHGSDSGSIRTCLSDIFWSDDLVPLASFWMTSVGHMEASTIQDIDFLSQACFAIFLVLNYSEDE